MNAHASSSNVIVLLESFKEVSFAISGEKFSRMNLEYRSKKFYDPVQVVL